MATPAVVLRDEEIFACAACESDLADLIGLFGDARVGATLGGVRAAPAVNEILCRWLDLWRTRGFGPLVLRLGAGGEFVGYCGLTPASAGAPGEIELLYALVPSAWGRGLATRASGLVVRHAFSGLGLTELVAYTLTTNQASRRVLEKLGFGYERRITHAGLPHVFYRLSKSHWETGAERVAVDRRATDGEQT